MTMYIVRIAVRLASVGTSKRTKDRQENLAGLRLVLESGRMEPSSGGG